MVWGITLLTDSEVIVMSDTRISRIGQIGVYVGKCFRMFVNEKGWKLLISAAIISIIISWVIGDNTFTVFEATKSGVFALICACIWIGLFNSIRSVCKERAIIKREHRTGLHISSYVVAHLLYEMVISLAESLIVVIIVAVANLGHLPEEGVLLPPVVELMITFFLIIFASDALGLLISSIVRNENAAMTVMPFILIIQLVMSGLIFELSGAIKTVSALTISRWGLDAICATANTNAMGSIYPVSKEMESTVENLLWLWGIQLLFVVVYTVLAIAFLEQVDKDKR